MEQHDLVSIVIPVYNGEKYIDRTVSNLLKQTYQNIEIILVPNNCSDNSVSICNAWADKDSRVRVFENQEKGTSLARKRGVLESRGEYITFHDQDDEYNANDAIECMHRAIKEDDVQIVQFNEYIEKVLYKKKGNRVTKQEIQSRENIDNWVLGASLGRSSFFSTSLWSKMYDAGVMREAVNSIKYPMYYTDDALINLYAFTNSKTQHVSCRPEAYYIWKSGGFSSQEGAHLALLRDYRISKVETVKRMNELNISSDVYLVHYSEYLWCYRSYINSLLYKKSSDDIILKIVSEIEGYEITSMTKSFFLNNPEKIWTPEMNF